MIIANIKAMMYNILSHLRLLMERSQMTSSAPSDDDVICELLSSNRLSTYEVYKIKVTKFTEIKLTTEARDTFLEQ